MANSEHSRISREKSAWSQWLGKSASFFAAMKAIQVRRKALVGRDTRPCDEPVRLRAKASLTFPPNELSDASEDQSGKLNLEVAFLGLFGPSGALPNVYTQLVIDRVKRKDHALREFLDLFNHRWLSLFYRAWEKHDFPTAFQTSASLGQEDDVTRILYCLIGFGTPAQRRRLRLDDSKLLYYSGLLSNSTPRQSTLEAICRDWFGVSTEVRQFQGQWLAISDRELTRAQDTQLGQTSYNALGFDSVAGDRVWHLENRFRLRIGPLTRRRFDDFSPGSNKLLELVALVRTYVGPEFDFDIQAVVSREEVPVTVLSSAALEADDDAPAASRLGWNTWLGDWPFEHHAEDAVFDLPDELTLVERPLGEKG